MKPPVITTAKQPRPAITPAAVIKDVLKSAVSRGPVLGAMVRPALLIQFWPLADHLRKQLSDSFKPAISLQLQPPDPLDSGVNCFDPARHQRMRLIERTLLWRSLHPTRGG